MNSVSPWKSTTHPNAHGDAGMRHPHLDADKALVFNIQHYSLHDGPGIRTIVFLKGCPLRCRWCCNPESQEFGPEISYSPSKCIGKAACSWCTRICPQAMDFRDDSEPSKDATGNVIPADAAILRHDVVNALPADAVTRLANHCPAKAMTLEGKAMTVKEVLDVVQRDEVFFDRSGGGLTVSGGEPLTHRTYLRSLLAGAHERGITTAIETCGYASYAALHDAAEHLDSILFDVKSMDTVAHRQWTDFSNERILDNLRQLCRDFPDMPKLIRTPIIPGFNDSRKAVSDIIDFLHELGGTAVGIRYQPLPYHRFGAGKYAALGRPYPMGNVKLDMDLFAQIREDVLTTDLAAPALLKDEE